VIQQPAANTTDSTETAERAAFQGTPWIYGSLGPMSVWASFGHHLGDAVVWLLNQIGALFRLIFGGAGGGLFHGFESGGTFGVWLLPLVFWTIVISFIGLCTCDGQMWGAGVGAACGVAFSLFLSAAGLGSAALCSVGVYLVLMGIIGFLYRRFFSYRFPALRRPPELSQSTFSFGLFDAFNGDPDFRICLSSLFCTAARWADTASASAWRETSWTNFWVMLFMFSLLASCSSMTAGISALLLIALCVWNRQTLRQAYGLPSWTPHLVGEDCLTYVCCAPCATMQEALQAEFVDVPPPAFPQPRKQGDDRLDRDDLPPTMTMPRPAPAERGLMGDRPWAGGP